MSKPTPLSGFPELLPAARVVEREAIASLSRTFELHGFANIETRAVEPLYRLAKGGEIDPTLGFERRWVVYNGYAEASRIPPAWHSWIHHTTDVPPTEQAYKVPEWQKPHLPNMTGTAEAYRPSGSTLGSGRRPKATGDYQAWTPGS